MINSMECNRVTLNERSLGPRNTIRPGAETASRGQWSRMEDQEEGRGC